MKTYFSPGRNGFFSDLIHGDAVPSDAVEITAEQHQALLDGQAAGQRIVPGEGGLPQLQSPADAPLDELRARKVTEIERARDAAIAGGFDFAGTRYDSDAKSIQRINGAITLSLLNPAFETDWITFDNSVVRLNATQLAGLGAAAGQHEATQIFRARQLKDQALAASNAEAIGAIRW